MYNKMNSLFEDMSKYYCFDKKKYNMEDFFGDIKIFQDSFKVHCSFILWHVISMFCCQKYIYIVRATIAFPYKCYCTSIFGVQIIMYMTISTFIFKTCDHSADIQDCMLKIHNNLLKSMVKSVFCVERAISATSYKHCKRLHFLCKYSNSLHLISWRYMHVHVSLWFLICIVASPQG